MIRWLSVLLVSILYFSPVHASLDRKERLSENRSALVKSLFSSSSRIAKDDDFRITSNTEVRLDGRPCPYEKIPQGATIVLLETVTNESKEIARIHFRSPKRSTSPTTSNSR